MMRAISVPFILANACFLVGATKNFLRSGSQYFNAKARLQQRALQLASALHGDLIASHSTSDFPLLVVAARDRLGDEADQIGYSDPSQAYLLREYARRAPPTILLVPTALSAAPEYEPQPRMTSSSVSEESVFQSDGQGNAVIHTTRCKDGDCVEQLRHGKQLPADAELSSSSSELAASHRGQSVSGAISQMAHEMEHIQNAFGHNGLDDMLNDVFTAPDSFPDSLSPSLAAGQSNGTTQSESWSTSTQTEIVNGEIVQKKQECKNGKCTTKMIKAHAQPQDQPEDSMTPPDQHAADSADSIAPGRVAWREFIDPDRI